MNRTERLYALVEELRGRSPRLVSAADLARRFEVSTRTIERDLLALQEAGVPVWSQPGPGGGYTLRAEATLPPLNLTAAEAAAVAIALAATRAMPFAAAGRSALQKLSAVMAAGSREGAERLVGLVRVAPDAATAVGAEGGGEAEGAAARGTATVELVQRALLDGVAVVLAYRDGRGSTSERTVEPGGIFGTRHGWYLAAWCRMRQGPRAFRLDRIEGARLTEERIEPRPLESLIAELPYDMAEPALM